MRDHQIIKNMFGSYFLKSFLIMVFENTENIIFVFFKNYSCFLNVTFLCFSYFSEIYIYIYIYMETSFPYF